MENYVTYEDFGAVGDGKTDDFAAIVAAHDHANANALPVITKSDAVYYIGGAARTAVIKTDTDWNTSRFIIDDTDVADYEKDCFLVPPLQERTSLPISSLSAGQTFLDLRAMGISLDADLFVTVYNENKMQYIRLGLNQDSGSPQTDSFILKKDGTILSGINWDYDTVTGVHAIVIDETPITVRGGIFKTIANRAPSKYNYYARGLHVMRSNTTIEGIRHEVTGEGENGAPYTGFFNFTHCADITMKNCFVSGHKIYETIGSAGAPVRMGTYDINAYGVVGIRFIGIRQEDICNRQRWGVFGSNFCKQILFDDCVISRTDAHCGLRDYTIRNSVIGWMGTNTIGFGEMLMENVTCYGSSIIGLRHDFGCTWDGNMTLRNITWVPAPGVEMTPVMIFASNNGQHDFGYPCSMPTNLLIENVTIVDTHSPKGYTGPRVLANFDSDTTMENYKTHVEPYPIKRPETITIRGLRTLSGKAPIICDNPALLLDTNIVIED